MDSVSLLHNVSLAFDGAVGVQDHLWLQGAMNVLVGLLRQIGLAANATKTEIDGLPTSQAASALECLMLLVNSG